MDKKKTDKFEPLTSVTPKDGAGDTIDLKEQDQAKEPAYLEDRPMKGMEAEDDVDDQITPADGFSDQPPTADSPRSKKSWIKYGIILVVLFAVAAAAYWFLLKPKPAATTPAPSAAATPTTSTTTDTSSSASSAPAAAAKIATTTKTYTSSTFNLTFAYPTDWLMADAGGGVLTTKSPALQLKNASNETVSGSVVFTVRDKAQKITELTSGNSVATRDSLKIAYTKPTQTQRGSTYVSYLQYSTTSGTGVLDGLYITGDNGYTKGQSIPLVDVQKVDPIISISFVDTNGKALSIADSMMDSTDFGTSILNILKSLSIN